MVNFTRPDDPMRNDKPDEWLGSSLLFCRAIALILQDNEGIVVVQPEEAKKMKMFKSNKVIVFRQDKQIQIIECEDTLKEGQILWMVDDKKNAKYL
jgi:hypothetical protein